MAVFDKELIINGKAVRSPEQQVYKNMKDIEALQATIKPMFKTTDSTLTSSSVSVALANTNVGTATEGWLLDPNGLLFKITGNDETTVTLQYYSDLKGPQGEDGAAVNIDDSITSLTKVWSSQKTNNEIVGLINDNSALNNNKTYSQAYIGNIINNGLWYSTTQPVGTPATINVTDIVMAQRGNPYCENTIQQGDMFFYVDNSLKASELYVIDDITSGVATVQKICDIGGGKQLYQHNIVHYYSGTNKAYCALTIINDSDTPLNTKALLVSALWDLGYKSETKALLCNGSVLNDNNSAYNRHILSVFVSSSSDTNLSFVRLTPSYGLDISLNSVSWSDSDIYDTVVAL